MDNNPTHAPESAEKTSSPSSRCNLNIIVPLICVFVCAIVAFFMVQAEIKESANMHGEFVCSLTDSDARIVFESNGKYTFFEESSSAPEKGEWETNASGIVLKNDKTGKAESAFFIDGKYIAFDDENFLKGNVPDESLFDAEFSSEDGTVYIFEVSGKCYTSEDGRNTELGKYITDGKFIIITIDSTAHTYLNCGDGLTPVFYSQI